MNRSLLSLTSAVLIAFASLPARAASKTALWMGSIEYAALRHQNDWKGWETSQAPADGVPRDIAWVRSPEFKEQCAKSYELAWAAVSAAAKSRTGELAVVMDMDETFVDNFRYQVERGEAGYTPDSFDAWVKRREAGDVPFSKEFIDKVRGLGPRVHLVYITDRNNAQEADTIENIRANGTYRDGDVVLTRKDKADNKGVRRACVERGETGDDPRCKKLKPMTIVAQVGDSIRDFYEIYGREAADQAAREVASDERWGRLFFMIPNPMYGQWERDYK